jgi:hypothetical protein
MKSCELCKFDFIMETRTRSFRDWEKLDMNHIERRKVLCSVTFHLIGNSNFIILIDSQESILTSYLAGSCQC